MAKWRSPDFREVPEQLARYVASEWPDGRHGPEVEWCRAVLAWLDGDPARRHPLGNRLDIIQHAAQRTIERCGAEMERANGHG